VTKLVEKKRLYVAIFRARATAETFIKVGVSAYPLAQRFAADLARFTIESVIETEFYQSSDALIVESNFHQILRHRSYSPKVRLRSGNSECFVHSDEVLIDLARIFNSKRHPASTVKQKPGPLTARKKDSRERQRLSESAVERWNVGNGGRRRKKQDYVGKERWGRGLYQPFG
jgi:hypothetical protein